jgi:hypothetical protein
MLYVTGYNIVFQENRPKNRQCFFPENCSKIAEINDPNIDRRTRSTTP